MVLLRAARVQFGRVAAWHVPRKGVPRAGDPDAVEAVALAASLLPPLVFVQVGADMQQVSDGYWALALLPQFASLAEHL